MGLAMVAHCLLDSKYPPTRLREEARSAVAAGDTARESNILDELFLWIDAYSYLEFTEELEDLRAELQQRSSLPEALAS